MQKNQKIEKIEKRKKNKKIKYFKLLISFALAIFIFIGIIKLPIFKIDNIEISGNKKINEEELMRLSNLALDKNIIFLKTDKIADKIKEIPLVETANVKKVFPSKIVVEILEREPVSTYKIKKNYLLIDKYGVIIGSTDTAMLNSTALNGIEIPENVLVGESIFTYAGKYQRELLERIFDGENIFKFKEIELKDDEANFVLKSDTKVIFGPYSNIEYKLDVLDVMIKSIEEDTSKNADMIFLNQKEPVMVLE